jgi:polynucleotide 5'-hydroxyl-kinase GRC3/NOL9
MPPFQVDCSTAFDNIILIGAGSEDVVDEELSRVLNGAVVGLVVCDHGTIDQKTNSGPGVSYTRGGDPPSPLSSKCVGLAAVRGISPLNRTPTSPSPLTIQLLTPVPYPLLSQSRVLVKGELELPIWAMLDFRTFFKDGREIGDVAGVEPENVPYLQWGKAPEGVLGAEKRKIRRNIMRRGQL